MGKPVLSLGILLGLGLLAFSVCGCSGRKKDSAPEARVEPPPAAVVPDDSSESPRDLQVARIRLEKIRRELAEDAVLLGKMQNKAVKEDPEIAAMEKDFLKERQAFVDRLNAWPGVKDERDKLAALDKETSDLIGERDELVARHGRAKDEAEKKELSAKMIALRERFEKVHHEAKELAGKIDGLKDDVRKNDPEMKTLHAALLEKQALVYIGKPNELPEIAALRKTQDERRKEIRELEERTAALRMNTGQEDEGGKPVGADRSKEIVTNG